jgi:ATP-dependent Clp protease protease subunit
MKKSKYFMLTQTDEDHAELSIFGDITSWPWSESDVSAHNLSQKLKDITVSHIDVHINSYGGEVAEGLAIYNVLKNHSAEITTYCDGFACSIASVIFMAGDKRVMNPASLLMIHNPWMGACGNADALRKAADDLDVIENAVVEAYKSHVNLSDNELKSKLDNETWITPDEAISWGFATEKFEREEIETIAASMSEKICAKLMAKDDGGDEDDVLTVKIFKDELDTAAEKMLDAIEKLEGKPPDNPKESEPGNKTPNKLRAFFLSLDGRKEDE